MTGAEAPRGNQEAKAAYLLRLVAVHIGHGKVVYVERFRIVYFEQQGAQLCSRQHWNVSVVVVDGVFDALPGAAGAPHVQVLQQGQRAAWATGHVAATAP